MTEYMQIKSKHWVSRQVYLPGDPAYVLRGDGTFSPESGGEGSDPRLEPEQAVITTGSALVIDYALGSRVALTLSHNITSIAVQNWPAAPLPGHLILNITSTGAYSMTGYPANSYAQGGVEPSIGSGAGKRSTVILRTNDPSSIIYVDSVGDDYLPI